MNRVYTVLIVEDEAEIRELIAMVLQDHQFQTIEAESGEEALRLLRLHQPDLVLLDVMMPGMDGFTACRLIREQSMVPVIFLTSKWESEHIVTGLDIGGDDYVTKPFTPEVLVARIKSHLRRYKPEGAIRLGELEIYPESCEVRHQGERIPFLAKELSLFLFLADHPRQVFSAEQLYESLWDHPGGDSRTVMVHISNIRKKLKALSADSVQIETIKGIGYRLVLLS